MLIPLVACGEVQESAYATLAEAKADGAMQRGWIPEWVPDSAVDIREIHDLDINHSALSLRFTPNAPWNVPKDCEKIIPSSAGKPTMRLSSWPRDVPPTPVVTPRHAYFKCVEGFVAINTTQGELFLWTHGI